MPGTHMVYRSIENRCTRKWRITHLTRRLKKRHFISGNLVQTWTFWPSLGYTCIGSMCSYQNVISSLFPSDQFLDSSALIEGPSNRKLELPITRPTTRGWVWYLLPERDRVFCAWKEWMRWNCNNKWGCCSIRCWVAVYSVLWLPDGLLGCGYWPLMKS